ncbi:hypothetical protein Plhal304r1_c002g0005301 [Plasmopara halstedii]
MRGAFYVATALLIATNTRTSAASVLIKSLNVQTHDVLQTGETDAETLSRRSLKGSGDQLATPAAGEERMNLSDILKEAGESVIEELSSLNKAEKNSINLDGLSDIIMKGEYLGSPAALRDQKLEIFHKNFANAVARNYRFIIDYQIAYKAYATARSIANKANQRPRDELREISRVLSLAKMASSTLKADQENERILTEKAAISMTEASTARTRAQQHRDAIKAEEALHDYETSYVAYATHLAKEAFSRNLVRYFQSGINLISDELNRVEAKAESARVTAKAHETMVVKALQDAQVALASITAQYKKTTRAYQELAAAQAALAPSTAQSKKSIHATKELQGAQAAQDPTTFRVYEDLTAAQATLAPIAAQFEKSIPATDELKGAQAAEAAQLILTPIELDASVFKLDLLMNHKEKSVTEPLDNNHEGELKIASNIHAAIEKAAKNAHSDNIWKLLEGLTFDQTVQLLKIFREEHDTIPRSSAPKKTIFDNPWQTLWYLIFRKYCEKDSDIVSKSN